MPRSAGPKENTSRCKSFLRGPKPHKYPRSSTGIKDAGAVPANPITNFRPLFLLHLQQTMSAYRSPASPPVLSL